MPSNAEMLLRVMNNNVVCSTCHDQHTATPATGGRPRVSPARKITALGGTGIVSSGGTFTGATGFWYLVEIQTAGLVGALQGHEHVVALLIPCPHPVLGHVRVRHVPSLPAPVGGPRRARGGRAAPTS